MIDKQHRIVAYLDDLKAWPVSLPELQSATGEELGALLPSAEGATAGERSEGV